MSGGKPRDIRGQRFGRWTVLDEAPERRAFASGAVVYWRCRCDCGTVRSLRGSQLANGYTKSCGCLKDELTRQRARTHGESKTREYGIWTNMIQRCHNPSHPAYSYYGGRGLSVCAAWRASFAAFRADMGPRPSPLHTIERVDTNRGYEPANCIWADRLVQGGNTRTLRLITYQGLTKSLAQWSRETGLSISAIHKRLTYFGWSVDEALTVPIRSVRHTR